jgi:hypothetical protein
MWRRMIRTDVVSSMSVQRAMLGISYCHLHPARHNTRCRSWSYLDPRRLSFLQIASGDA